LEDTPVAAIASALEPLDEFLGFDPTHAGLWGAIEDHRLTGVPIEHSPAEGVTTEVIPDGHIVWDVRCLLAEAQASIASATVAGQSKDAAWLTSAALGLLGFAMKWGSGTWLLLF